MGIRRTFRTLLLGQRRVASRGARHEHETPRNNRWLLNRRFVSLMALSVMASLIGLTGAQTTASAADEKVTISFTFDDGNDTQYAALPVFARYGMHSTLYVNTGLVGNRDIMTWSQLEDFADAGHEIGGHTAHHTGLTEVSESKARAEIQADVDALQAHGFPRPVSFAYPYGYWGDEEAEWVKDAGYTNARTTDVHTREPNPPANPFGLRVIQASLDGSEGLDSLKRDVTAAEAAPGKTWLIYLMHDFYSPIDEEIDDFLRWLQPRSANGTVVKTMGEVMPPSGNEAPVADAGSAQTVSTGSTVQLDGSGSSDPDGDSLTYQWTQTGGTPVTLSSSTAEKPTFTAPSSAGTLNFRLVVRDGQVDSSADTVAITVQAPPVGGPGYRSSSSSGDDAWAAAVDVPVPAGAAAGDIVVASVSTWGTSAPAITAPAGFTLKSSYTGATANGGTDTTKIYWKRLTASDTGSYRFTWSGSRWSSGQAIAISGASASGDPLEVSRTNSASSTTFPATSVTTTGASLLAWFGRNDEPAPGTHTAPSGFTEVQDKDCSALAYQRTGSAGTYSAAGGSYSGSANPVQSILVAVRQ